MKTLLCFLAFIAALSSSASAKAYYQGEKEMIERSEAIAIVAIARVEETETKAEPFDYRQIAHATVEQILKGTLPQTITLYGMESFICAQVRFAPGRYLVFLRRDGERLVGVNWHFSARPLRENQIEWYAPGKGLALSWQPFDEVIGRVRDQSGAASSVPR